MTTVASPLAFNLVDSTPAIRIRRMFDIRQVLNSEMELQLSFDVPMGIRPEDIKVQVQKETLYIQCGAGVISLPFRGVDVCNVKASLSAHNCLLKVVAPKNPSGAASHCNHVHAVVIQEV